MAKSSPYKLAIILAIVTSVIGFIQYQQHIQYKRGYDAARVEMFEQYQDDLEIATKNTKKDLDIAIENRDHWKNVAIGLQSRKPVTVTKYVEKIIENNPDCTHIEGFDELHSKLTEAF